MKTTSKLAFLAWALAALVLPTAHASAADAGTLTISDNTPTRTESWGVVVHAASITIAPGATVKIVLDGPVLPGYKWEVTALQFTRDCNGDPDQPTGNDFRCFSDSAHPPVLSSSGSQFEDTLTTPSIQTTLRIDYGYFPPMQPGQTTNTAIKVFEAEIVVK